MPLPKGTKYRYKKGTNIRLAFKGKKVIEVKNMMTGDTKMIVTHKKLMGGKPHGKHAGYSPMKHGM